VRFHTQHGRPVKIDSKNVRKYLRTIKACITMISGGHSRLNSLDQCWHPWHVEYGTTEVIKQKKSLSEQAITWTAESRSHILSGSIFYLLTQAPILGWFLNPIYFKVLQNDYGSYLCDIIMCQHGIWWSAGTEGDRASPDPMLTNTHRILWIWA